MLLFDENSNQIRSSNSFCYVFSLSLSVVSIGTISCSSFLRFCPFIENLKISLYLGELLQWNEKQTIKLLFVLKEKKIYVKLNFMTRSFYQCAMKIKMKWKDHTHSFSTTLPFATWLGKFVQSFNWNSKTNRIESLTLCGVCVHTHTHTTNRIKVGMSALCMCVCVALCGKTTDKWNVTNWWNFFLYPISPDPHPTTRLITIIRRVYP